MITWAYTPSGIRPLWSHLRSVGRQWHAGHCISYPRVVQGWMNIFVRCDHDIFAYAVRACYILNEMLLSTRSHEVQARYIINWSDIDVFRVSSVVVVGTHWQGHSEYIAHVLNGPVNINPSAQSSLLMSRRAIVKYDVVILHTYLNSRVLRSTSLMI